MSPPEKLSRIQTMLDAANAYRKIRCCFMVHVVFAVREALEKGVGSAKGGWAFYHWRFRGPKPITTKIATIKLRDGAILVDIGSGYAMHECGPAVHGPKLWSPRGRQCCLAWAESVRHTPAYVVLYPHELHALVPHGLAIPPEIPTSPPRIRKMPVERPNVYIP